MGFFSELFGLDEVQKRDDAARSRRDEFMKAKREREDAVKFEENRLLMIEIEKLNKQAEGRKNGWFW